MFPYQPPHIRKRRMLAAPGLPNATTVGSRSTSLSNDPLTHDRHQNHPNLQGIHAQLDAILLHVAARPPEPPTLPNSSPMTTGPFASDTIQSASSSEQSPSPASGGCLSPFTPSGQRSLSPPVTPALSTAVYRSLKLNKTVITYTQADVPDPVAVSFSNNIPRLNRMWDDTSAHWDGQSVLTIVGQPIALVYWPEVFRYGKKKQWQGTKAKWFEWKVRLSIESPVM